jgi:hypothetical protein
MVVDMGSVNTFFHIELPGLKMNKCYSIVVAMTHDPALFIRKKLLLVRDCPTVSFLDRTDDIIVLQEAEPFRIPAWPHPVEGHRWRRTTPNKKDRLHYYFFTSSDIRERGLKWRSSATRGSYLNDSVNDSFTHTYSNDSFNDSLLSIMEQQPHHITENKPRPPGGL